LPVYKRYIGPSGGGSGGGGGTNAVRLINVSLTPAAVTWVVCFLLS